MKKFLIEISEEDFGKLKNFLINDCDVEEFDSDVSVIDELFWLQGHHFKVFDLRGELKIELVKEET